MSQNKDNEKKLSSASGSDDAMRALYEGSEAGIYVCDFHTGEIIVSNSVYASGIGKTVDGTVGKFCYKNMGYDSRCPFCPHDKLLDENGKPLEAYTWENYFEKFGVWLQCTNKAVTWVNGKLAHMVTFIDITKHREAENALKLLAYQDRELGILNSLGLERDLKQDAKTGRCLVVLDLHGLDKINTAYGRNVGDTLLQMIKDFIIEMNIQDSTLYRLEIGDFGILLEKTENDDFPRQIAETLQTRFNSAWPVPIGDQIQGIFASASVCVVPAGVGEDTSFGRMYGAIEHTLEVAGRAGGVAIYNADISAEHKFEMKLETSLKNAVRNNMNGFHLVYQPVIEPGVIMWNGVEALCRWNSPELGAIPPSEFIPAAEACGLIGIIGLWVLEQSVAQVKEWGLDKLERFLLDVNLSPAQLATQDLDKTIVEILKKYDYPPEKLCLELTESSEFIFSKHTVEAVMRLSETGIVIALDDFGTGYSSFSTLHKLPIKVLKTNRSLISGLETDSRLQHLFYIMVELAHGSDMKIIAEGVETDSQAEFLLKQGADYFQGYFFSQPVSPAQMERLLHNFSTPSKDLAAMGYSKLDLAMLNDDTSGYNLTPALNLILNRCMKELFSNTDGDAAINVALSNIGQGLGVSRSYLFIKEPDGTYSNTNEWCAPGINPEKDSLQNIPIAELYPAWLETLRRDGLLVASDITTLDDAVFDVLNQQGIKAAVEFPIWKEGELYGFVGFDDCVNNRRWSREEVQMLHTLTSIITSTLGKMWLQEEITNQIKRHENVLNNMDTVIYVTDLDTNEILFANSGLRRLYGDDNLTGRVCWEALQKRTERCEFCPIPVLLSNPEESFTWEYYNELLGRHFRIRDSIISWTGNKRAHLEYAEDITELKISQKKLEVYASTDMLTTALNRTGFLASARELLYSAEKSETHVTVAFIDIDGLKKENDTFGHAMGDKLIVNVVKALRDSVRDSDIIGRYGGDEFVIVFSKCSMKNAEQRMQESLKRFNIILAEAGKTGIASFSYGLAENTEIPYSASDGYVKQLIDIADKRMFDQKNKKYLSTETLE